MAVVQEGILQTCDDPFKCPRFLRSLSSLHALLLGKRLMGTGRLAGATSFNQPIEGLNTASVTSMFGMCASAPSSMIDSIYVFCVVEGWEVVGEVRVVAGWQREGKTPGPQ